MPVALHLRNARFHSSAAASYFPNTAAPSASSDCAYRIGLPLPPAIAAARFAAPDRRRPSLLSSAPFHKDRYLRMQPECAQPIKHLAATISICRLRLRFSYLGERFFPISPTKRRGFAFLLLLPPRPAHRLRSLSPPDPHTCLPLTSDGLFESIPLSNPVRTA